MSCSDIGSTLFGLIYTNILGGILRTLYNEPFYIRGLSLNNNDLITVEALGFKHEILKEDKMGNIQ